MTNSRISILAFGLVAMSAFESQAAVKLTAMQIISVDTAGKIQGVGSHRFKTTHGGQPCILWSMVTASARQSQWTGRGPQRRPCSISRYAHLYDLRGEI
jgi:hypothetical protein